MVIWIALAVMTAAVVAALVRPLLSSARPGHDSRSASVAMYREQLDGIERERRDGLLGDAEAESARAEVARRLLDAARDGADPTQAGLAQPAVKWTALGVSAALPILGVAFYLALGAPNLPGQPHAQRAGLSIDKAPIGEIVAKVEARLQEAPNDGAGWDAIAPVYLLQQRYADAARAFGKAIDLLGATPKRLTGFAEASIRAADGIVNDKARGAYEKLLTLDPSRIDARFWIALGKEQDGDVPGAVTGYREVAASQTADERWREASRQRLAMLEKKAAPEARRPAEPDSRQGTN